jgi:hypothetical protein
MSLMMVKSACGSGGVGFRRGCWLVRYHCRCRWRCWKHFAGSENARLLDPRLMLVLKPNRSRSRSRLGIDTVPRLSSQSPGLAWRSRRLSRRKRRRRRQHIRSFRIECLRLAVRIGCRLRRRRRSTFVWLAMLTRQPTTYVGRVTYRSNSLPQVLSSHRLQTQRETNRPDKSSTNTLEDASNGKNR